MRELLQVRLSYETEHGECVDAHRLVRNAIAVAGVLALPFAVMDHASSAVERVENAAEPRFTHDEAVSVLALVREVRAALDDALDAHWQPRNAGGNRIVEHVAESHDDPRDRVFEQRADGTLGLAYPRMSLFDLSDRLPDLERFLADAVASGSAVSLVDA